MIIQKWHTILGLCLVIFFGLWALANGVMSIVYYNTLQICFSSKMDYYKSCAFGGHSNASYSPVSPIMYFLFSVVLLSVFQCVGYFRYRSEV